MERISEEDVDCFLQQMEQLSAAVPVIEKRQEEWRHCQDFCIWVPEVFQRTDREKAEEIFWSEQLPDAVFINEDNTAGITLQRLETAEALISMAEIRQLLEKLDDRIVFYDSGMETEGIKVHWLEYKSFAADVRVYNVLFVFGAGEKEILGTFYCIFEEYEQWKPVIWEIMQTIKEEYKHEGT
ncbi:MAG: hypothetical protein K2L86_07025 [Lachnospiraceae bacterium]|nr:hypothetical protein [Lachnospiraceae bacterium]